MFQVYNYMDHPCWQAEPVSEQETPDGLALSYDLIGHYVIQVFLKF